MPSIKRGMHYYDEPDLSRRLEEHNKGESQSTKFGIPWIIVRQEEFETRAEAMKKENQIKNRGVKRYLNDLGC